MTWFGSGLLPGAPGTWGSLAALPFAWLLLRYGGWMVLLAAAVALFLYGVWMSERYARARRTSDPPEVVIDEVAGQWLTLVPAVDMALWQFVLGFALFRLFDIVKPWPANRLQARLAGGWGIMTDDAAAAAYGAAILLAVTLMLEGRNIF